MNVTMYFKVVCLMITSSPSSTGVSHKKLLQSSPDGKSYFEELQMLRFLEMVTQGTFNPIWTRGVCVCVCVGGGGGGANGPSPGFSSVDQKSFEQSSPNFVTLTIIL